VAGEQELGGAVFRLSTDDRNFLASMVKARAEATKTAQLLKAQHSDIQEKYSKRFQHVGVEMFGRDLLNAAGVTRDMGPVLMTARLGVEHLGHAMGGMAGPIGLAVTGLTALVAVILQAREGQKAQAEALAEASRQQMAAIKTTSDLNLRLDEYEETIGRLPDKLLALKAATEQLDRAQRDQVARTMGQQLAAVEAQIASNRELEDGLSRLAEKYREQASRLSVGTADYREATRIANEYERRLSKVRIELDAQRQQFAQLKADIPAIAAGYSSAAEETDRLAQSAQRLADFERMAAESIRDVAEAVDNFQAFDQTFEDLEADVALANDEMDKFLGNIKRQGNETESAARGMANEMKSLARASATTAGSMAAAWATGKQSFVSFARTLAVEMTKLIAQMTILKLLGNSIAGGFAGGFASGAIGGLFGGMRAEGGDTEAGKAYWVGEDGPELHVPRHSGRIIPAAESAAMGTREIKQYFTIQGVDLGSVESARKIARVMAAELRAGARDMVQLAQGAIDSGTYRPRRAY